MNRLVLSLLVCILFVEMDAQPKPFTYMDVFELEWASDPQISPDGTQILYLRNSMDIMKDRRVRSIWKINANGKGHMKLTDNDKNERSPRWSPSGDRIIYTTSTDQGSEIHLYWKANGKSARITQLERSPSHLTWSPDGKWIAFVMRVPEKAPFITKMPSKPKGAKWAQTPKVTTRVRHESDGSGFIEPGHSHYFIIPAEGGTPRQITYGDYQHSRAPQWTPDSKRIIFSANRKDDWEYTYRDTEIFKVNISSGEIEQLTDRYGPDRNPVLSPDGRLIAYSGYDEKTQAYQVPKLYLMNIDGSGKREIKLTLDRAIQNLKWDSRGKGLYFQYDSEGNSKIGYVDLNGRFSKIADNVGGTSVARPYGGGSFSISDQDDIALNVTTPNYPAELAIIKKGSNRTQRLTDLNMDILDQRTLGKTEEIWYKSSYDERDIQGWIVYPPYYDSARKYPLIVENHGGPISNYGDRFSPEMQLYASAGYVVFYPNPRGSTSYGEEFANLLHHNYPGQDYDDVMSGVDALLEKGIVDADSLFVTGGSAGGIMTAWIIGKNNRFRAAAVIKPVMNWYSKTLTADNWFGYYNNRLKGYPWENPEHYMKFSPISLVGNIETPTLVMVGSNDLRTPLSESKQLYHALKIRRKETALVEMPGAYHFIANRPSQLIAKINHIVAWFDRYRGR